MEKRHPVKYSVSGYDNDYEDQGMRACQCGEFVHEVGLFDCLKSVAEAMYRYVQDYDPSKGDLDVVDEDGHIFIDWRERGNDRCWGIDIELCEK